MTANDYQWQGQIDQSIKWCFDEKSWGHHKRQNAEVLSRKWSSNNNNSNDNNISSNSKSGSRLDSDQNPRKVVFRRKVRFSIWAAITETKAASAGETILSDKGSSQLRRNLID